MTKTQIKNKIAHELRNQGWNGHILKDGAVMDVIATTVESIIKEVRKQKHIDFPLCLECQEINCKCDEKKN